MTRLEELTLGLADELLTDAEAGELQALLAESAQARQTHFRILRIEGSLRGARRFPELAPLVMARMHARVDESITQHVMTHIRTQPPPEWLREQVPEQKAANTVAGPLPIALPGGWTRWSFKRMWLPLAACLSLATGLGVWFFGPVMGKPVLAEIHGEGLLLERAGQPLAASPGISLQAGDVLRTPQDVSATIDFGPEKTRLLIDPGAELKLGSFSHGKVLDLRLGKLEASVARQRPFCPMILNTPQARARVLGTRFTLDVASNSTRLEVTEGKVRFTRLSDLQSVKVTAGNYAVATANSELAALPLTGSILREWWGGIEATNLNVLRHVHRFLGHPDGSDLATAFELEPLKTNHFAVCVRGYLHPPETGSYEFWVAGSTIAYLFISPDDRPAGKVLIARTIDDNMVLRNWDAPRFQGGSQWAPPVPLVAGRMYYIEAQLLIKKREGHLSVAWKPPGGERELLSGKFLSPAKLK